MSAPVVIETARLILRPHVIGDFVNIVSLWQHPDVTQFTSGNKPSTLEECWQRLLRYHGLWPALGFGYFSISDKQSGAFVGEAGLADFHRDITPSIVGRAEAGWALLPSAWGKGYAQEALMAIFDWYEATPHPRSIVCIINPDNAASVRLAKKIGFKLDKETRYKGNPCLMFERQNVNFKRSELAFWRQ